MKALWILALLLFASVVWARKPYKLNLDPMTAEQLLASLVIKPRLSDKEWKDLLTAKLKSRRGLASQKFPTGENHKILPNENLWNIAKKSLGSPWFWPKIWATNPDIENPHEIEIGRLLAYYREEKDLTITIPLIKLVPSGGGRATNIENDSFLTVEIKNRFRSPMAILTEEDPIFGQIRGSYTQRSVLYVHEPIYVEPYEGVTFSRGERFAVIRKEREIKEGGLLARNLGDLVRILGEVEILRVEDELTVAEVKMVMSPIRRGDLLIPVRRLYDMGMATTSPPDDLQAKVVQAEDIEVTLMAQGQTVIINRGSEEGMMTGYKFRVYRDMDPATQKVTDVLPDFKGEIKIIATSKNASIGLILRNDEPILKGDLLVPAQRFANRPPPPQRPVNVLEVD